jgi:hypothetical protein
MALNLITLLFLRLRQFAIRLENTLLHSLALFNLMLQLFTKQLRVSGESLHQVAFVFGQWIFVILSRELRTHIL